MIFNIFVRWVICCCDVCFRATVEMTIDDNEDCWAPFEEKLFKMWFSEVVQLLFYTLNVTDSTFLVNILGSKEQWLKKNMISVLHVWYQTLFVNHKWVQNTLHANYCIYIYIYIFIKGNGAGLQLMFCAFTLKVWKAGTRTLYTNGWIYLFLTKGRPIFSTHINTLQCQRQSLSRHMLSHIQCCNICASG